MFRKISAALFLLLASVLHAAAGFGLFQFSTSSSTTSGVLKVGAGGYVTGLDVASDGTKVVKTDVGGGYYCPAPCAGPGGWIQVISSLTMPAGDSNVGLTATNGTDAVYTGVYEIRIAPSQTSTFYVYYFNNIYKGTYAGGSISLTKTNFTTRAVLSNDGGTKIRAYHMAVHPTDPNTVVAGGADGGIAYTTNGGTSWTAISGLCTPSTLSGAGQPGGYFPAFDPNNANKVYIGCYGTGVYASTTGVSGTFSLLSGTSPTDFINVMVGSDGSVCATDGSSTQSLWGYFSGAWTNITLSETNSNRGFTPIQGSGRFYVGADTGTDFYMSDTGTHCGSGGTWTGMYFTNLFNQTSPDIGWISADSNYSGPNMSAGAGAALDPANNRMYVPMGVGVMYVPTPTAGNNLTWIDHSAPMEELVANRVNGNCGSAGPFVSVWDRGIFKTDSTSNAYPTAHGTVTPNSLSNQIVMGWDLDCSNTVANFVVCLCDWFGVEQSGYSTNGGSTWTVFSSSPNTNGYTGGNIAAGDDQTILWGVSGSLGKLFYTTNRGGAWTEVTTSLCTGFADAAFGFAYYLNRYILAADKSLTNTFYVYNNNTPGWYKLAFSGGTPTCTKVHAGALDSLGFDGVSDGFNSKTRTVPGQSGNLFYTSGFQSPIATSQPLWRSTDGGANWSQVSGVFSVQDIGFGKAKPGGSGYPAIFIYGFANGATVPGVYRSDDNTSTWVGPLIPCPANITQFGSCVGNSLDLVSTIDGDVNTYGKFYVGYKGTGYAYATSP